MLVSRSRLASEEFPGEESEVSGLDCGWGRGCLGLGLGLGFEAWGLVPRLPRAGSLALTKGFPSLLLASSDFPGCNDFPCVVALAFSKSSVML